MKTEIRTLNRTAIADQIANILRQSILAGELEPGVPLRQHHLAKQFSVSHIPIREALGQLSADGLVTMQPNKGAVVRILSVMEIEEVERLRRLLESELLERAIHRLTSQGLKKIKTILDATADPLQQATWYEQNWRFHSAIYSYADAPITFSMAERLNAMVARSVHHRSAAALSEIYRKSHDEHLLLVDLIGKKDVRRAVALLKSHIQLLSPPLKV